MERWVTGVAVAGLRAYPARVNTLTGMTAITGGSKHSLAF